MIAIRSAHNPDNLRGDGLDLAIIDEAAYMPATIWHDVLRPMLATIARRRPLPQHPQRPQTGSGTAIAPARIPCKTNGLPSTSPPPNPFSSTPLNWLLSNAKRQSTSGKPNTKPSSSTTAARSSAASPKPPPQRPATSPFRVIPMSPASIGAATTITPPSPLWMRQPWQNGRP